MIVEALDRDEKSLGKSKVVQTIPAVQQAGKLRPGFLPPADVNVHDHSGYSSNHAISILTNPIATFVSGFFCCATIVAVSFAVWRSRTRSLPRPQTSEYEPLKRSNQDEVDEDEAGRGDEEEHDGFTDKMG